MAVAAAWWSAPRPPQSDDSGSSKEGTIMRKLLAALCLLAASQSPDWAKSAPAGVWLFDDAPDYPGVTMLELAVDDGAISGRVTTLWYGPMTIKGARMEGATLSFDLRNLND